MLADGADQIKTDLAGTALLDHYGRIRNVVCVPVEGDAEDLRLFDYAYTRGPDGQRQRLELTAAVCRVVSERNFCIRPKKSRGFLSRLFGKVDPVPTGHGSLDEHYEIVVEPGVPVPHLSEGFADRLMRSGENVTIEMINSHALIYRRHERVAGRDLGSFADEAHSLATLLSRS